MIANRDVPTSFGEHGFPKGHGIWSKGTLAARSLVTNALKRTLVSAHTRYNSDISTSGELK